jgi:hypothetical protein
MCRACAVLLLCLEQREAKSETATWLVRKRLRLEVARRDAVCTLRA